MITEETFNIKPLSLDDHEMLNTLIYRKDIKITCWSDKNYDYCYLKTLDQKHLLAKFVCETYEPTKWPYKYTLTMGNGDLISQGYVNNTGSQKKDDRIDQYANDLLKKMRFIVRYNSKHPSLLTVKTKENNYILQYVSNFINPGVRKR